MSRIEKDMCDSCGRITSDRYAETGWIHFAVNGGLTITVSEGRDKKDQAITIFHKLSDDLDFCSLACFSEWIKEEKS